MCSLLFLNVCLTEFDEISMNSGYFLNRNDVHFFKIHFARIKSTYACLLFHKYNVHNKNCKNSDGYRLFYRFNIRDYYNEFTSTLMNKMFKMAKNLVEFGYINSNLIRKMINIESRWITHIHSKYGCWRRLVKIYWMEMTIENVSIELTMNIE